MHEPIEHARKADQGRLAEDRYRTLVHHSVDVLAVLDAQGIRRYISPGTLALSGHHADELVGRDAFDLVHPDDLAAARGAFAEVLAGPGAVARVQLRVRHADGSWVEVEVVGCNQLTDPVVLGVILNIRDISERKKDEAARLELERQLAEARKRETVGVLAGGLAHDFNNLMTTVLGYASLARLHVPASSELAGYLGAIEQAASRVAVLCRQMLAFAGNGQLVPRPLDLSSLVGEGREALAEAAPGANLCVELAEVPRVEADVELVRQVVANLVRNAFEALPGGAGTIRVRTQAAEVEAGELRGLAGYDDPAGGRYAVLEVEDTGCGMDEATRQRVFDPFFSTKFLGRGLGLAAALGIVRSHKGVIDVAGEPGRGSRFRVFLPAC